MKKTFFTFFYYAIARWLPGSNFKFCRVFRSMRVFCAKFLFAKTGKQINIERGVYFGSGKAVELGDYSGLGVNCSINGPVKIGAYVMMAPDVVILARNHKFDRLDIPMHAQGADVNKLVTICDDVWIGAALLFFQALQSNLGPSLLLEQLLPKTCRLTL